MNSRAVVSLAILAIAVGCGEAPDPNAAISASLDDVEQVEARDAYRDALHICEHLMFPAGQHVLNVDPTDSVMVDFASVASTWMLSSASARGAVPARAGGIRPMLKQAKRGW